MALKDFLKSKIFFKHLLFIVLSFILIITITSLILKIYTRHGDEYSVPKIVSLNINDIADDENLKNFEIMIIDSVYKEGAVSGTILTQDPSEGSLVKKGRKIYITVASYSGDVIRMPSCTDRSLKSAVQTLIDVGLKIGTVMYRTGDINYIVTEQRFNGKPITKGSDIITGESIDLVVEVNSTTAQVSIPDITSKTEQEAEIMLWKAGLNVGRKIYQGQQDASHSRVVSFSPSGKQTTIGTAVNITLMNDSEKAYRKQIESFRQNQQIEELINEIDTTDTENENENN